MTTTNRYTTKSLKSDLVALNAKLEVLGHQYRFVIGGRNGYTAIDLATPEQDAAHCCQRMLIGGTPRECLAEANAYVSKLVPVAGLKITQCEMGTADIALAEQAATARGYTQTAYTSSSAMIGLFCLRDSANDRKPDGCFVKTREFGLLFISDLEDLQLHELAAKQMETNA